MWVMPLVIEQLYLLVFFNFLFCTMTNKCTIISQIITLLHVSTLFCHPQGACNQYLAKLHKFFKCILHKTCVKHLNFKLHYQQLNLKYLCNLARYWLQASWGWHDSVETCRSVIICEIIVHLLVIVQNNKLLIHNNYTLESDSVDGNKI
jgi:hypothetical protein